jgi:hypothetical protein
VGEAIIHQGGFMRNETEILRHAEVTMEALALGQAMLDGDVGEARFRALQVLAKSRWAGLTDVTRAAEAVIDSLGHGPSLPTRGYGQAIEKLSRAIDQAQGLR